MLIGIMILSFFYINDVEAISFGRVTNEIGVNVRSGPGSEYTKTGNLKYNDVVPLFSTTKEQATTGCSSGWYRISHNGLIRYVCSNYLSVSTYTTKINYSPYLNSRNGAGTNYSIYKRLDNDKLVTLSNTNTFKGTGCSKGWYSLNYNTSKTKYICSTYTDNYNSNSNIVITNIGGANIRMKPSGSSTKVATLKYGQALTLDSKAKVTGSNCSSGWYKVYYNGSINYICSSLVANKKTTGIVNNISSVNIREKASNTSKKMSSLSYNSIVALEDATKYAGAGCSSGYYKIHLNNATRYACSSLISTSSYRTYINDATANVRAGAGNTYSKITSLVKNSTVILQSTKKYAGSGCSSGWYKISINGKSGYVCSSYTKLGKGTTTSSPSNEKVITKRNTEYGSYYTINKWTYRVNEDYAYVRTSPTGSIQDTVYLGTEMDYLGTSSATSNCSSGWYKVKYFTNKTGYICKTYVDKYSDVTKTNSTYCNTLKNKGFPSSYCPYLSYLHSKYPNWVFKPEKTGINFLSAINGESGKNYTQITKSPYLRSSIIAEAGGWRVASDAYVAFMIDPRNYLNEKNIFAFLDLNYNENSKDKAVVRTIFDGTYLDNDTYAGYFVNAAKNSEVRINPAHLAARAKQEGATNSSYAAVSGKVSTKWNNSTGYVCSNYTKIASQKYVSPTGSGTNIRSGPGTGYKITAITNDTSEKYLLQTETKYTGTGCSKGWYKLNYNGETCYICGSLANESSSANLKGYINTTGSVNIRSGNSTNYGIVTTANNKDTFTLYSTKKYTGTGCSGGWYKIKLDGYSLANIYNYYNIGSYGDNPVLRGLATAAGYVDNEYGTPWNTREKAITYGARWIAKGYIKAGQDTLYYQKFNTGPDATASAFTHQYQTNILAPASEGLSFNRAYKDASSLSQSLVFKIPVYTGMSSVTTHPPVK